MLQLYEQNGDSCHLSDPVSLPYHISRVLHEHNSHDQLFTSAADAVPSPSAVLLLLGPHCAGNGAGPCLILNKRSRKVRQPGDLCCPGGGLTPRLDAWLAKLLRLPGLPLRRWPYLPHWQEQHPTAARHLTLFLATGLREAFEEMRLNPFGVRFLGPLPPQHLRMFRRVIYPMAAWVPGQKHFVTNWEVDEVVSVPLRYLLIPEHYARYRLRYAPTVQKKLNREAQDFPCVLYEHQGREEILWGATYRIVMGFLEMVFGFKPPEMSRLPLITGKLRGSYLTGRG